MNRREAARTRAVPTSAKPAWRTGLALMLAGCLGVKLFVLSQLHGHPLLQPHGELDTATYIDLAQRLARDGLLGITEPFFVSPLYVYFLAATFAGGGGLLAAKVIQVALGTAAVALLFATTRHWFGARAAAAAAILATATGLFTFYEVLILQAAIDPFLVAATLYAVTRTAATGRRPWSLLAGVLLGLIALNRPNALAYAPVAAGLAVVAAARRGDGSRPGAIPLRGWRDRRWPAALGGLVAMAIGLSAVLGLNALRNYVASGQAVVIASHGGLNFYIGNHAGADGTYSPVPGIRPSVAGQATDARQVAEASIGGSASPAEVSAHFYGLGLAWIREHPGEAARLLARKVAILLNRVDVPLNHSYAFYATEERTALRWLAVGPWLLVPVGLVGLGWRQLRERQQGFWAWGAFVPVYGLTVAVFFVSSRYRMPLLVPLCAATGAAVVRGFDLARARRVRLLALPLVVAALLAVLANWNLGLDDGVDGEQTRRAVWLVEQGAADDARAYAQRVSPRHAHPGVLAYRLGVACLDAGRPSDAADWLRQARDIDGPRDAILLPLGRALLGAGRPADAAAALRTVHDRGGHEPETALLLLRALLAADLSAEAARLVPSIPDRASAAAVEVMLDVATGALEQGDAPAAERTLRLAVARAPRLAEAHEKLGLSLFLQGRPGEALPWVEAAVHLAPDASSGHLNLAAVLAELRRYSEARRHAEEAARLDPSEPRAAALVDALRHRRPQP